MGLSRRVLLVCGGGFVATAAAARLAAQPSGLAPTPRQTRGPYYPVAREPDQDWDLTQLKGRSGRAKGQVIEVTGRVLRADGRPEPNAKLDLWQANAAGRYMHPGDDRNEALLDPNFQGSAIIQADAQGRYRYRTIKPGAYPAGFGDSLRPPHIHLEVTGRGGAVVTQMYFPGEALNERDGIFRGASRRTGADALIARAAASSAPGLIGYSWDVVLPA